MPETPNYQWPTPADDDAIRDGAAAMRALGDAIDQDVAAGLAGKADDPHTHDGRYYTEAETDALLDGKADDGHTHGASVSVTRGSYTGDGTAARTVSLGFDPKLVVIIPDDGGNGSTNRGFLVGDTSLNTDSSFAYTQNDGSPAIFDSSRLTTGGFELDDRGLNETGVTYYYTAIG